MNVPISRFEISRRRQLLRALPGGPGLYEDHHAADYIAQRGFVMLAPVPGLSLPSLSEADARTPWSGYTITDGAWRWKEVLPGQGKCAYGKFIRNRGTFISWEYFPFFYAAFSPGGDWENEYRSGHMDRLTLELMNTIAELAPVDSRELWRAVRQRFGGNRPRFTKALEGLQARYFVMVSGGSLEGWSLHRWDLVTHCGPAGTFEGLPDPDEARLVILKQLIRNCVCCHPRTAASVLRLPQTLMRRLAEPLVREGTILEAEVEGEPGMQWTLAEE